MNLDIAWGPLESRATEAELRALAARGGSPFHSSSWEAELLRLKNAERKALILWLQYSRMPEAIWDLPLPVIALAGDWNLLWHVYRGLLPRCELVLTDTAGVEVLGRAGIKNARAARLYGVTQDWLAEALPPAQRDIDILFVGNFNPAVQGERLKWLGRVAQLGRRWKVVLASGVFGEEYHQLHRRARIVFNRSVREEWNLRASEALATGALLFQEEGNREVAAHLRDRHECVLYNDGNLETLLEYYLEREEERREIAEAAWRRRAEFSLTACWHGVLDQMDGAWPELLERSKQRHQPTSLEALTNRVWQALCGADEPATAPPASLPIPAENQLINLRLQALEAQRALGHGDLLGEIESAMEAAPRSALLHNLLGVAVYSAHRRPAPAMLLKAAGALQSAWQCDPALVLPGLNLAQILLTLGQRSEAIDQLRRALTQVQRAAADCRWLTMPPLFGGGYDSFRVAWEQAGWANAGEPEAEARAKRELLEAQLHELLGECTNDLAHFYEAAALRPQGPTTRAALGCALGRKENYAFAAEHLRRAVEVNPFDQSAARALADSLVRTGATEERCALARHQRLLAQAAPKLVAVEPWMEESIPIDYAARPEAPSAARVSWEGPFASVQSLALINREICRRLLERGWSVTARETAPTPTMTALGQTLVPQELRECLTATASEPVDVHVAHQWPPKLTPPSGGHWVLMQPWEFGSLPRAWLPAMQSQIDEVWVPSRFVRNCFIGSGVGADRVYVVPNGVSPVFFGAPQPFPLKTSKKFKFLFVGGTIARKGFDILLAAYGQVFSDVDDVCLVVKDFGASTFYQGQTAKAMIDEFRSRPHAPEIEHLSEDLDEPALASLYAACDCLVHPFRGEGFGLPILEAMAAALPVIVTGYGPVLDYADDQTAYLLPASLARLPERRIDELETVDYPWLAMPSLDELRHAMRKVIEHPQKAKAKGRAAADVVRERFTWEHTVNAVENRLQELRKRPPRRRESHGGDFGRIPNFLAGSRQSYLSGAETTSAVTVAYGPSSEPIPDFLVPSHQSGSGCVAGAEPLSGTVTYHTSGPAAPVPARQARVSLCMIVKNEEANLPACLSSVAGLADEIIVVDTGSTDASKAVATRLGARVFDFPWCDSFAAARNESLRHATGDWIFWMDADDRLDEPNRQKLGALLATLGAGNSAYVMKCLCLPDHVTKTATVVDHIRLFPNDPQLRWAYRIHEQVLPAIRRLGGDVRWSDVVIQHVGYQDPALRRRKLERDLRLLLLEYSEQPEDPFTLFNLGSAYQEQGRIAEALPLFEQSLRRSQPSDSIVRKLYALIIQCQRSLGRPQAALATCNEGRRHYRQDAEILFQESLARREVGDRHGAKACLEELLNSREAPHFASVDTALRGYKARHNLAVILHEEGKTAEAERAWQQVLAERSDFGPALQGLGELYLLQKRWNELAAMTDKLLSQEATRTDGLTLRGRGRLAQRDFGAARRDLEAAIGRAPGALWPRMFLSHVLLQEGRDWDAAERTLREILVMDPAQAEAKRNLEVLLEQQRKRPN